MADEEKTDWTGIAARLRDFEARMADQLRPGNVIPVPGNPVGFDPFHFYGSYAQTVLALAEAERMVDWSMRDADDEGDIICSKHGRQRAITVRPGKFDCAVCCTTPDDLEETP